MRFIADGMLGKLTRWLRMLGQDVKYSNDIEDSQLLFTAKMEKRILLTRDFQLYRRAIGREIDAFYLEGTTGKDKLAELAERYKIKLEIDMTSSRCPKCNGLVEPISIEMAVGKVEKETLDHYKHFWECSICSQVYWQGAHWIKIKKTLSATKAMTEKSEKGD